MAGPDRVVESDFSRGMFWTSSPDLIPVGGVSDAENVMFDESGSPRRRGGTDIISPGTPYVTKAMLLWQGHVNGPVSIVGGAEGLSVIFADGHLEPISNGTGAFVAMPAVTAPVRAVYYEPLQELYWPGAMHVSFSTAPPHGDYNASETILGALTTQWDAFTVASGRLFRAKGSRIFFSGFGADAGVFAPTDYHELPDGAQVVGLQGLRDSVVVFSTGGVWIIRNVAYDLTDDTGNVQQRLDRYSGDLMLWGDAGIAEYEGALIVPARDGVWSLALGESSEVPQPVARLSDPISQLWRYYVGFGCKPGVATVYQGHYFLPILTATNDPVGVLVCRLDLPRRPWSRFSGYGGQLTVVAAPPTTEQGLLGHGAGRLQVLRWLDYSDASDGDGSNHLMQIFTRRIPTGALNRNTVTKLRLQRETTGTTTVKFEGDDLGTETTLGTSSPPDPEGVAPYTWPVRQRTRLMRARVLATAACRVRAIELWTRSYGKL